MIVEEFQKIPHTRDGARRACGICAALEQLTVLLHVRSATGGVHDDPLGTLERVEDLPRKPSRRVEPTVMRGKGAAADLTARDDHAPAVAREHAYRRSIDRAVPAVLHASREHGDGASHPDPGRRLGHVREWPRQVAEARPRDERSHAPAQEGTRERHEHGTGSDDPAVGEHYVEAEPSQGALATGAYRFDLRAGALHHPAERDVRRADVLACPARQAEVHERGERVVDRRSALGDGAHRGDASPGARGLLAGQSVRGAVRKAQAAGDAARDVGVGGMVPRRPVRRRRSLVPEESQPRREFAPEPASVLRLHVHHSRPCAMGGIVPSIRSRLRRETHLSGASARSLPGDRRRGSPPDRTTA